MLDRQQVETILCRRFPSAPLDQIATAVNAIMGLARETSPNDRFSHGGGTYCGSCRHDVQEEVAPALPSRRS